MPSFSGLFALGARWGLLFVSALVISVCFGLGKVEARQVGGNNEISYSSKKLPAFVRKMRQGIYKAARSGDLEMMRTILETNELLPLIDDKLIKKPVDYWIKNSAGQDGLSIFAAMSKVLEAGYSKQKEKKGAVLYVWPYFARIDLKTLKPYQKVELYRTVSVRAAQKMMQSGRYTGYSLGIGEDGTWHFFGLEK